MFSDIFQRFIQKRPVAMAVLILLENFLNADKLDRWFNTVRQSQYTKEILFSSIVGLMINVVCKVRPSVHSAYRDSQIHASVGALYAKLQNMELTTSQALVRYMAGEAEAVIQQVGGTLPALLPGYRVRFLDGNSIEVTEHRLEELRETNAGALPGKTLVVFDPQLGLAVDVWPCEDGHAQERALLPAVVETIQPQDVYVMDRNFCVLEFLLRFQKKSAFFVTRQHSNTPYKPLAKLEFIGDSATGKVFEQTVGITAPTGEPLQIRRVVVTLNKPTRKGDKNLILLTNLPKEEVDALKVAELYRARWGIETAFQIELGADPIEYVKGILDGEILFSPALCLWVKQIYSDRRRFDTLTVGKAIAQALSIISEDYKTAKFQKYFIDQIRGNALGQQTISKFNSIISSGQIAVDRMKISRTTVLFKTNDDGKTEVGGINIHDRVDLNKPIILCAEQYPKDGNEVCKSIDPSKNAYINRSIDWFGFNDTIPWTVGLICINSISYTDLNGFKVNSPVLVNREQREQYRPSDWKMIDECAGDYLRLRK